MPLLDRPIVLHEATGDFLSPNPATTTRTDFTKFFLNFSAAPDAHELYKHLFDVHQNLIRLLVEDPAMRPNLEQTFSTPANSKNKVYFYVSGRALIYGVFFFDISEGGQVLTRVPSKVGLSTPHVPVHRREGRS
jgi:hypothetical protein